LTAILSGSGNSSSASGAVIVGGGFDGVNSAPNTQAFLAFIGNGLNNVANGNYSGILSGSTNSISAANCTVMGGLTNSTGGANSFVAGKNVKNTVSSGSFVWADTSPGFLNGGGNNTFTVRASGGTYIMTSTVPGVVAGVTLAPGGGTWMNLSDARFKRNIYPVDINLTLDLLSALTVYTWNFIGQGPSIIHIGPMAQDVYSVFLHNEDPRYINDGDAIGVLMASVQALYQNYIVPLQLKKKIWEQEEYIAQLRKRLRRLEDIRQEKAIS
jgi:hypothetical protein